jgi:cell division septal protein FtsQ
MKKSVEHKPKIILKRILHMTELAGGLAILILLIYSSFTWCNYIELFNLTDIEITGNSILADETIIKIAAIQTDTSINNLDLSVIQQRLEQNPYIRAAAVSRDFPNKLEIRINERIPICYLSQKELFLIDAEGILLPPTQTTVATNLPVISGFENDSLLYQPGLKITNPEILTIVKTIHSTLLNSPDLFSAISEIHSWNGENYILYTIKNGTPIFLGNRNLSDQFDILANFQNRLKGKRELSDYQYLDLRWEKQVVVKERRS